MKVTVENHGEVVLTAEADSEGRWIVKGEGSKLPRQNDGVTEYTTNDGLHVIGLIQLVIGAADSLGYLRRKLNEHNAQAKLNEKRDGELK